MLGDDFGRFLPYRLNAFNPKNVRLWPIRPGGRRLPEALLPKHERYPDRIPDVAEEALAELPPVADAVQHAALQQRRSQRAVRQQPRHADAAGSGEDQRQKWDANRNGVFRGRWQHAVVSACA
jgi:hypothetical protein